MSLAFSPAADRNRQSILEALERVLPPHASVLEIASGTGQHAAHFAAARPDWRWQPTDADARALPDIDRRCAGLSNVARALRLDVAEALWPSAPGRPGAAYCANMLHIAPWAACAALMRGVANQLEAGGILALYGPYLLDDVPTAPSNLAFDADLRARDVRWGLRRLADVVGEATQAGMTLAGRVEMPANNLLLVFKRTGAVAP